MLQTILNRKQAQLLKDEKAELARLLLTLTDFDVITEAAGDVYARYRVRLGEMRESLKILDQALEQIEEGSN